MLLLQSAGGQIFVLVDGQGVSMVNIPATGGWQNWQNVILQNINLTTGTHKLTLRFTQVILTSAISISL
ncbi:hypothetical protein MASR2M39_13250 [Ignavibacteriales bacterium]